MNRYFNTRSKRKKGFSSRPTEFGEIRNYTAPERDDSLKREFKAMASQMTTPPSVTSKLYRRISLEEKRRKKFPLRMVLMPVGAITACAAVALSLIGIFRQQPVTIRAGDVTLMEDIVTVETITEEDEEKATTSQSDEDTTFLPNRNYNLELVKEICDGATCYSDLVERAMSAYGYSYDDLMSTLPNYVINGTCWVTEFNGKKYFHVFDNSDGTGVSKCATLFLGGAPLMDTDGELLLDSKGNPLIGCCYALSGISDELVIGVEVLGYCGGFDVKPLTCFSQQLQDDGEVYQPENLKEFMNAMGLRRYLKTTQMGVTIRSDYWDRLTLSGQNEADVNYSFAEDGAVADGASSDGESDSPITEEDAEYYTLTNFDAGYEVDPLDERFWDYVSDFAQEAVLLEYGDVPEGIADISILCSMEALGFSIFCQIGLREDSMVFSTPIGYWIFAVDSDDIEWMRDYILEVYPDATMKGGDYGQMFPYDSH